MAKQTAQLFLKALVIGVLLQVGLRQVPTQAQTITPDPITNSAAAAQ